MTDSHADLTHLKALAVEMSRDPAEGLNARERALFACLVIPEPIQKWMVEAGAVEPLLDSIEKTILAAESHRLNDAERAHVEACRRHLEVGAEIRSLSGQRALLDIIDRLTGTR